MSKGMSKGVAKVELHCHLEGTASPDLIRRLASRNGIDLPAALFNGSGGFAWTDFHDFLDAYDLASACIRSPRDYRDVTYEYLASCAEEGAIYVEVFSSPDHAAGVGMNYAEHLEGIVRGIDDAQRDHGIMARIIVTCIRHLGPERGLAVARAAVGEPHPYVVGFGMGGDETVFTCAEFAPAFGLAADGGLACTVHAGEIGGPDSVRDAIENLPVTRIGHGVRAVEEPALMEELVERGIVLEVCPGSNLALGLYPNPGAHPLKALLNAGCRVTLGSDDPPYFRTSIGREYAAAATDFGLSEAQLKEITLTAVNGAFVDEAVKVKLRTAL